MDQVDHAVISGNLVRDHGQAPRMAESVLLTGNNDSLALTGNLVDKGRRGDVVRQ